MHFTLTFIFSFLTWIIFSGKFDPFHLGLGVLASTLVAYFSGSFFWSGTPGGPGFRLSAVPKAINYTFWMVYQILLANFHVFFLAVHPRVRQKISPKIIHFKTRLRSDFAKYVLANSITLTPGTVTIQIENDVFTVHAISHKAAASLPGEMERRVAEVFDP